ncbi:MAG: DGQHR domain-containing protein [Syntrophobacteraceae bacterium]|jgi:DGQHR domain-containing protein
MNSDRVPTYRIPVLGVEQPIGGFFIGVLPAKILREITYSDIRRLENRSVETYTGIERPISPQRVAEIKQYIKSVDATFPNSIIVAVKRTDVVDARDGFLTLRLHNKAAKIIDGQHRLAGFDSLDGDGNNFEMVVAIFVEMDVEDQAMVFATINLKQTKVSRSLVYDLFELTKTRSPQKTCHDLAKTLNSDEGSPFYHRIKLLGRSLDIYEGTLTQGTFVKYLLPKISSQPDIDRDILKRKLNVSVDQQDINRGQIFREYFARNEDWAILKVMRNYFSAIATSFPSEWADPDNPLPRAIGYGACMKVLNGLYAKGREEKELTQLFFETFLARAKGRLRLSFDDYPANAGGEHRLAKDLFDLMGLSEN